mmetsp:Transcript_42066/g.136135  ORF Transcript_42066/g.136135 Transcript_42066/m.136135 type:complete len:171 (-) Transcript_42066:506-1018(-)
MNPAWEQADEEYEGHAEYEEMCMLYKISGPFSPGRSPGRAAARSRKSSTSIASAQTTSSDSTTASHLSEILSSIGLDRLPEPPEAGQKGQFNGAACYDGNGARKWPTRSESTHSGSTSGSEVREGPDERGTDDDFGDEGSVSAGARPAGSTLGKIHSGKIAGTSTSKVSL